MTTTVYFGCGTQAGDGERAQGIFVYHMEAETGQLTAVQAVESGPNPTFLTMSADRRFLFAVNETGDGGASSFEVDRETGRLSFINRVKVGGDSPCYISLDPSGQWLLAANYSSGSLSVLPVGSDGRLGERLQVVRHEGSSAETQRRLVSRDERGLLAEIQLPGAGQPLTAGVRPERQERAHAHSILFGPSMKYALAADLGQDRLWVYRQAEDGRLAALGSGKTWTEYGWIGVDPGLAEQSELAEKYGKPQSGRSLEPGSGPRHLAFHASGRFVYVSNELASTVTVFGWESETGALSPLQNLSTLPEGYEGKNDVAHLALSPDGRFLYVSNRGHDSLAAFAVNGENGRLEPAGHYSTQGDWPRNFGVTPDGRFVLAANQQSDSVVVLRVDRLTGALEATGDVVELPQPMYVMALDL